MEDRTIEIKLNSHRLDANPAFKNNNSNIIINDEQNNDETTTQDTVSVTQENQDAASANIISAELAATIVSTVQGEILENPESSLSALANYNAERVHTLLG